MHRPGRRLIFPGLLATFALLYLWRMSGVLPVAPVSDHVSNFYLTGAALTLVSGPRAFVDRAPRSRALVAAAVLAVVNVGAEVVLPILGLDDGVNAALGDVNTSDPIDCVFGLAAIVLVLALLPRQDVAHHPESPGASAQVEDR